MQQHLYVLLYSLDVVNQIKTTVNWCKILCIISLLIITLHIFPDFKELIKGYMFACFKWAVVILNIKQFSHQILLRRNLVILIPMLFTIGIISIFFIYRLRVPEREKKDESGRYVLQRRAGQGWNTIKEYSNPVTEACLNGYPLDSYRLMKMGDNGRFQEQVWYVPRPKRKTKISLRNLHSIATRDGG